MEQLYCVVNESCREDAIDPTTLFQGGKEDVVQYFFDHNWLIRYVHLHLQIDV